MCLATSLIHSKGGNTERNSRYIFAKSAASAGSYYDPSHRFDRSSLASGGSEGIWIPMGLSRCGWRDCSSCADGSKQGETVRADSVCVVGWKAGHPFPPPQGRSEQGLTCKASPETAGAHPSGFASQCVGGESRSRSRRRSIRRMRRVPSGKDARTDKV